ncbi:MAG: class I SAM-dependent methyltransferase [Oscillatoriales cyanobacterium RM2_1_1]|nr:class I SAM-dependent methyltransferase [Oscillatoriales cyanobacterium SM2_3_0]NJO47312.1 class I SAM-dependent methyltransferase [Oscillatoriales cyanobacterium RM2_1_1]
MSPHIDIGYIPTPLDAVQVALELAVVTDQDILYDLGCGDGRVVIAAAQQFGARGIGIDINPDQIWAAQQKAEAAQVGDRVKFYVENLFESDFTEATVMFLYLLPHLNLKLKPRLLAKLRPGTRIISRDFDMGEWEPEQKIHLPDSEEPCTLYRWTVPPRVN